MTFDQAITTPTGERSLMVMIRSMEARRLQFALHKQAEGVLLTLQWETWTI